MCSLTPLFCWGIWRSQSLGQMWTKRWTVPTEAVLQPNPTPLCKVSHSSSCSLAFRSSQWWVRIGRETTQSLLHLQKYSICLTPSQSDEVDWLLHHPNLLSHPCLKTMTFGTRECNDSKIGKSSCLQKGVHLASLYVWKWSCLYRGRGRESCHV